MEQEKSINLFDTKANLSPNWQLVEKYLHGTRQYLLWFVLIVSIVLLVTYGIVRTQITRLEVEQQQLLQTIQNQSVKEALLLALRARINSLKKILDVQFSLVPYIDTALLLAEPPKLQSFSIGEKNTVQISVEFSDIGEAVSMMETIVKLVDGNQIGNPNLTSLAVDKKGVITMGITYSVFLKPAL